MWKPITEEPPVSEEPLPVWICLEGTKISPAFYTQADGANASHFATAEGEIISGVIQWMIRDPDRVAPFP